MISSFKDFLSVAFSIFLAMLGGVVGLFAAAAVVLLVAAFVLDAVGYDPSPSAPHRQAQIQKCYQDGGTVVLDNLGYLKECWIGPRP